VKAQASIVDLFLLHRMEGLVELENIDSVDLGMGPKASSWVKSHSLSDTSNSMDTHHLGEYGLELLVVERGSKV
jgi:hypothetical protein